MPKPVLLTVDDDPEVLRAIERDLRSRYADRYRVMRANSGTAALATLRELKARNNPVALLLADQRMPQMDGVNFLSEAMEMHPLAKRALLTAYADTNAAIDAINEARVHYYLMKPWDPPEEKLFPALDDLLHDWTASFRPPYEGIRVLGTRWSNRSYELREFLARNQVPYQWIDVELAQSDAEVRGLIDSLGPEADKLPLILFSPNPFSGWNTPPGAASACRRGQNRAAHACFNQFLRSCHRGRRSGGACCRRVWSQRGLAHGDRRARSAWRPSRT